MIAEIEAAIKRGFDLNRQVLMLELIGAVLRDGSHTLTYLTT